MNIFKKIRENVKYFYYRARANYAFKKSMRHLLDENDEAWRYWTNVFYEYMNKCLNTEI